MHSTHHLSTTLPKAYSSYFIHGKAIGKNNDSSAKDVVCNDRVSIQTAVSIAEMLEHGRDATIIRIQQQRLWKKFSFIKQTTCNRDEQCKFWKTQEPQKIETKNTTEQSAHDQFIERLKSAEKRISELQKSKDKKNIECNRV